MHHPLQIFPMTSSDIDEVMKIEEVSYPCPWIRKHFESELDNSISFMFVGKTLHEGALKLVSYTVFWLVCDEAHILNLSVHPCFRRTGFGTTMIAFAMAYMKEMGIGLAYLEVRKSNMPAIDLYKKMSFKKIGERKRYYENKEDALVMVKEFPTSGDL